MNYGHLELRIEELLQEKGISKNTICKELDIPRSNFNRYCIFHLSSASFPEIQSTQIRYFRAGISAL